MILYLIIFVLLFIYFILMFLFIFHSTYKYEKNILSDWQSHLKFFNVAGCFHFQRKINNNVKRAKINEKYKKKLENSYFLRLIK